MSPRRTFWSVQERALLKDTSSIVSGIFLFNVSGNIMSKPAEISVVTPNITKITESLVYIP